MSRCSIAILLGVVAMIVACKPGTPSQFIQPDEMEDILVEYHMAKALASQTHQSGIDQALYVESVLGKHGYTKEEFDSSLVYYYTRADRFESIYKRVADRLEEKALVLGATEGEIGKYASLNADGDTANIWNDRSSLAMIPMPPYNRCDFLLEGDSLFQRGDAFLLQFMSDFLYQSGNKVSLVYIAVDYGDTIVSQNLRFSSSGLTQLRFADTLGKDIKRLRGYFYIDNGHEITTTTRVLFLSNIQLIRFHNSNHEEKTENSLSPDTAGQRLITDTVVGSGDSVGRGNRHLPHDRGAVPDRVDAR